VGHTCFPGFQEVPFHGLMYVGAGPRTAVEMFGLGCKPLYCMFVMGFGATVTGSTHCVAKATYL